MTGKSLDDTRFFVALSVPDEFTCPVTDRTHEFATLLIRLGSLLGTLMFD